MKFNYSQEVEIWAELGGYVTVPLKKKRPLPDEWTKITGTDITRMLGYGDKWTERDITGYGILLGTPAGKGYVLIAVDIDLDDYDQIEELRSTLPISPMIKKGRKGMTLFYRTLPELAAPRVYKGMLDYLGIGRQTVMPGSIHPDTGKPYQWIEGTGPVPAHTLPILTEDHIVEMEEMLASLGWDRRYTEREGRHQIRAVVEDGELVAGSIMWLNRMALDNIPAWVEDLALFNGIWRGARYCAVNTMRSSSSGRPAAKRKRNLSIHPTGIKDFGSNETFSPLDLVRGYSGLSQDDAYKWLAERVDPNWGQDGGLDLLLSKAQALPQARIMPEETPQEVEEEGEPIEGRVNRAMGPLPLEAFESAPGFIGRCAREVLRNSPRMPKTMALLTAISTASALAARRYVGETYGGTLQLTTYVCAMSETGGGKDRAIDFGARLMDACANLDDPRCHIFDYGGNPADRLDMKKAGASMPAPGMTVNAMRAVLAAADMTGDSAFISALWRCACPWFRFDEFGSVFASLTGSKNRSVPVSTLIRKYYSMKELDVPKQYAINETVGDKLRKCREQPLRFPAPVIFGVTTPEQMYNALDERMNEDGTINRFIIAHEDAPSDVYDDTYDALFGRKGITDIDESVAREAIDIFTFGARQGAGKGAYDFLGYVNEIDDRLDVFARPNLVLVEAEDDDIREMMARYIQGLKEAARREGVEAFEKQAVGRIGENMLRLAYIAAVADNDEREDGVVPVVKRHHVEWAILVMDAVRRNLISLVGDHLISREIKQRSESEERIRAHANRIIDAHLKGEELPTAVRVIGNGWINVRGLIGMSKHKFRTIDRETLDEMQRRGEVEFEEMTPDGKKTRKAMAVVRFMDMFD